MFENRPDACFSDVCWNSDEFVRRLPDCRSEFLCNLSKVFRSMDSYSQSILLFQLNAHNMLNTDIYHPFQEILLC